MMSIGIARSALSEKWTVSLGRVKRRKPKRLDHFKLFFIDLALFRLFLVNFLSLKIKNLI
jgi:hypothetical protein